MQLSIMLNTASLFKLLRGTFYRFQSSLFTKLTVRLHVMIKAKVWSGVIYAGFIKERTDQTVVVMFSAVSKNDVF